MCKRESISLQNVQKKLMTMLFIFGNLTPFTMYTAVEHVPIGSAAGLSRTAFMLLSPLIAIWVHKEKMGRRKVVPIAVCTVGTILMCTGLYGQIIGDTDAPESG